MIQLLGSQEGREVEAARDQFAVPVDQNPTDAQVAEAADRLKREAAAPLVSNPTLRTRLIDLRSSLDQTYDDVSKDELLHAGHSEAAKERAKSLVQSFEKFIADNTEDNTDGAHIPDLYGEGMTFLGSDVAGPGGNWSVSIPSGALSSGQYVTATATLPASLTSHNFAQTSEFSKNVQVS